MDLTAPLEIIAPYGMPSSSTHASPVPTSPSSHTTPAVTQAELPTLSWNTRALLYSSSTSEKYDLESELTKANAWRRFQRTFENLVPLCGTSRLWGVGVMGTRVAPKGSQSLVLPHGLAKSVKNSPKHPRRIRSSTSRMSLRMMGIMCSWTLFRSLRRNLAACGPCFLSVTRLRF